MQPCLVRLASDRGLREEGVDHALAEGFLGGHGFKGLSTVDSRNAA